MRALANSLFSASIVIATAFAIDARADQQSENAAQAEALFREARELLKQGKAAEACPKLAASQKLDPGYGTLYNLADCQAQLGQTASAWASYREAADMAKKAGQADREKKATDHAAELEPKLERMKLAVTSPAPGLVVKRDGVALDPATFGVALPIDPGKHVVLASAPGKKSAKVDVDSPGPGKIIDVTVPALEDLPAIASTTSGGDAGTSAKDGSTQRFAGIAVGGAGVVGVVLGAIFGASASSKWSDAKNNHCRTDTLCDSTGVSETSDAKSAATISTIAFIAGGVAIAGGVVLFATAPKPASKEASFVVAPTLGGLVARGAF